MRRAFFAGAAAAVLLTALGAGSAQAGAINGALWLNDPNPDNASMVPSGPPDAKFDPGAVDYRSEAGGYTIGGFLNNPVFRETSAAFTAAGGANAQLDNVFLLITGTVSLNSGDNSFVLAHDDGAVLTLGDGFGTVLDRPGPTLEDFSPFTVFNPGAPITVPFVLQYTECCGAPADLAFAVNGLTVGAVPEPATWALLVLGVGLIGLAGRRRTLAAAAVVVR